MYDVEEDAFDAGTFSGSDGEGNFITISPDSSGDYYRITDCDGNDCFQDSEGCTLANIRTYD